MTGPTGVGIRRSPPAGRGGFALLCLLYVAVMLYASTIVGPAGVNFVFLDPADAFHRFLATPYVVHGSDQRADWIGNLLMLVPFGFLVAGTIWPRRPLPRPPALVAVMLICAAVASMLICATIILAIKYLQLFFPPRTVTLNYIVAQAMGAAIGCAGYAAWHERVGRSVSRTDPLGALVLALRLYCAALLVFVLMPLDFALSAADFWGQVGRLPDTVLALPGDGRPLTVRIIVIAMASAAFIPVGMLLVIVRTGVYRVQRGLGEVTAIGLAINTGVFAASTMVLGATPAMAAILYRTFGVITGAAILRWLVRQDTVRLRLMLRGLVPWAVLPYLLGVLLVNRLLSLHWLSIDQAIAQAYPLGVLPLFDYYIVSKAAAAKNIVGHMLLYMPIGVGLWLRNGRHCAGRAFVLATMLSFAVELGRYFRPGLEGDINAVVIAGLAALLATGLMPMVWSMLATLARQSVQTQPRQWQGRGVPVRPVGEVERY